MKGDEGDDACTNKWRAYLDRVYVQPLHLNLDNPSTCSTNM